MADPVVLRLADPHESVTNIIIAMLTYPVGTAALCSESFKDEEMSNNALDHIRKLTELGLVSFDSFIRVSAGFAFEGLTLTAHGRAQAIQEVSGGRKLLKSRSASINA